MTSFAPRPAGCCSTALAPRCLAGLGLEALGNWAAAERRFPAKGQGSGAWQVAIVLLVILELFLAGRRLAYNQPTAPAAFDSMRTAPAHLLADQAATPASPSAS